MKYGTCTGRRGPCAGMFTRRWFLDCADGARHHGGRCNIGGFGGGPCFGCNYKVAQIGRTIRYSTEYCKDKRYASFGNLLRTGNLYSEQFCYHTVPEKLDPFDAKTFREDPMDFFFGVH